MLRADGSAHVTTRVTINNTLPPNYGYDGTLNIDSLSFVTIYGPNGATLAATSAAARRATAAVTRASGRSIFRVGRPEVVDNI